jgi:hypothetical protein
MEKPMVPRKMEVNEREQSHPFGPRGTLDVMYYQTMPSASPSQCTEPGIIKDPKSAYEAIDKSIL